VIEEYAWTKNLPELEPADVVHFRNWLLQTKSRDLARRTLSSFHSIIIEMKHQGLDGTVQNLGVRLSMPRTAGNAHMSPTFKAGGARKVRPFNGEVQQAG
jgi:hypothetical protein